MRVLTYALNEVRRFRGVVPRLLLIGLVLVPLLYGGIYLWSNWDPYGRLDKVPIAVVNNDRPATVQGKKIEAGRLLVDQLKSKRDFEWHFVNTSEAQQGLRDGRYYFVISVPSNFSSNLAAGATGPPKQGVIGITLNDANGYLAGIMGHTVELQLQEQVNAAIYTAYAKYALGDLAMIDEGLKKAADGARKVADGNAQAKQASAELVAGLEKLDRGAGDLSTGLDKLAAGVARLDQVVGDAANAISDQLPGMAQTLVETADLAVQVSGQIATATSDAQTQVDQAVSDLDTLCQSIGPGDSEQSTTMSPDEVNALCQKALAAARNASRQIDQLAGTAQEASQRAQEADAKAKGFQSQVGPLQQKISDLAGKVHELDTGATRAADGARTLKSGLDEALTGARKLDQGLGTLATGSRTLATDLADFARQIPPIDPAERAKTADMLGNPTRISEKNLNPAHIYGRGMAPFFFAIALWVAALLLFQFMRAVNPRALAARTGRVGDIATTMSGWLPAAGVITAGAVVLYLVVDLLLRLNPLHWWGTLALVLLAGFAFLAITHFLRLVLGLIGTAIALVLLMLQLASSGGLYPMETTPAVFQWLHPLMPMSYLVQGLRVTISGGEGSHLAISFAVLAGFLLVFLAASVLTVHLKRRTPASVH